MVALRRYRRGFTLIELVIAIFVLLMMVLTGMPAFTNMMAQRRLMGAVGRVSADLRFIQSQAVRLGYKHQLSYAAGSYTLQKFNTATNAWVSLGPSYSVATDYTGVSLASIIDNAGAGVNVTAIWFRPQGSKREGISKKSAPASIRWACPSSNPMRVRNLSLRREAR